MMQFRLARHTIRLNEIEAFYTQILGLKILGRFQDHDGYHGIFLGFPEQNWHLEFTTSDSEPESKFDADDALVFYPETEVEYHKILNQLDVHSIIRTIPKNPYWTKFGIQFQDPDGAFIIISPQKTNLIAPK